MTELAQVSTILIGVPFALLALCVFSQMMSGSTGATGVLRATGSGGLSAVTGQVRTLLLVTHAVMLAPSPSWAQGPTLEEVLARAADNVDELREQLSGMVSEERYEQNASTPNALGLGNYSYQRRTLRSDYLLVQTEGAEQYYGFRDVFEVDGRPVRDRAERLTKLFLDPSAGADRQIQGIRRDSARYNIGGVARDINTPTFALLFLSAYSHRFEFGRVTDTSPELGLDGPDEAADMWIVEYKETSAPTVVGGREGRDLPAHGRFWIEPTTGRVPVSELVLKDAEMEAIIVVRYEANEGLGHSVPVEMRERYDNRRQGSRVNGTATYTRFRRFQVQVEESAPFRD